MFLINGMKATLIKYNREESNKYYDDQNKEEVTIKVCPYDVEQAIKFGIYTTPESTGYYQVSRFVDVREGDQLIFLGKYSDGIVHTVLRVEDNWLFNRVENYILVVK